MRRLSTASRTIDGPRSDTSVTDVVSHTLLLFPSIPLTERHQYGLVVTNRVLADAISRPLSWNLTVSNVPGPQVPFYVLGKRIETMMTPGARK